MTKPFTPARVGHDNFGGELPLGLARRWDREAARYARPNTRPESKRRKLEQRGTYQRRNRWRLEACRKRVQAAAESLAHSISIETGRPCSAEALLAATRS